jgi:hypothetical protein
MTLTLDLEDPRVPEAGPDPLATVSAATLALLALALEGQSMMVMMSGQTYPVFL